MRTLVTVLILMSASVFAQPYDTIQVVTGWNLIGSMQTGSTVQIINTIPSGIITGSLYGFNPVTGYEPTDNLQKGMGYWVKVNQSGKIIFKPSISGGQPCPGIPTVSYGGKTYNTVQVGAQCWMKENLDIGTMVPGTQVQANNGIIEKYCYTDNPSFCDVNGALYQWDEAMQYSVTPGVQGICPPGWHIPTLPEYETLSAAVRSDGNSLKITGQGSGAGEGTNTSGFSALLAGRRYSNGTFGGSFGIGVFWCSTQYNSFYAIYMHVYNTGSNIGLTDLSKKYGFSIRCVKD